MHAPAAWSIVLAMAAMAAPTATGGETAYRASRIWPGDGPPINQGVLIVRDGKVAAIGPADKVPIPPGTKVVDLGPAVLIPGLVAAESGLGGVDRDDELTITPELRAIDAFDFFEKDQPALAGGVTTVQLSPGRNRLLPGRGAVVKLAGTGPAERTLRDDDGPRLVLTGAALNPGLIYDPPAVLTSRDRPVEVSRPQAGRSLAAAVSAVRSIAAAARAHAEAPESARETNAALEALAPLAAAEPALRVTAHTAAEVRAAVSLGRELGARILLVGPENLRPFLDGLAGWAPTVRGVVLGPRLRPGRIVDVAVPEPGDPSVRHAWDDAAALLDAGLPVAIAPRDDEDLDDLLFLGGLFTGGGLEPHVVLRMLTLTPAELLGVSDRVGSLTPGKDADFAVLTADPFDLHGHVSEVFIAGKSAFSVRERPKVTVIRAEVIQTGTGAPLRDGAIVVEGTSIRGVGSDVSAPPGSEIRVFPGAVVTAGLIDLAADLGFGGTVAAPASTEQPEELVGSFPGFEGIRGADRPTPSAGMPSSVPLDTKLGERLVSGDPAVAIARRGGVTTVLTGPRGDSPGPLVAFKLGDDPTVLRDPVALRFALPNSQAATVAGLKRTLEQGKRYADSWTKYEADLATYESKKKEYDEAKAKLEAERKAAEAKGAEKAEKDQEESKKDEPKKDEPKKEEPKGEGAEKEEPKKEEPASSEKGDESKKESESEQDTLPEEPKAPEKPDEQKNLEPYRALFAGKVPALVEARRIDAIKEAVALFRDEFKLRLVLLNAEDAFRDPGLLAEKDVTVAVGPELVRTVDRAPVNLAQVLANRAVAFGFQSEASTGVRDLPLAVKYAVRQGLGAGDALAALTTAPAKMLGLEQRIGSIATGRDADLVVWSGPPFALSTRVLAVMIDGQWVYRADELTEDAQP